MEENLTLVNKNSESLTLFSAALETVLHKKKEVLTEGNALELFQQADFNLEIRYDFDSKRDMVLFIPNDGIKTPTALPASDILDSCKCLNKIRDCVPIDSRLYPVIREMVDYAQKSRHESFTHRQIGFKSLPVDRIFLYEHAVSLKDRARNFYYSGNVDLYARGSVEEMLCFIRNNGNRRPLS